jgi:hypothetical protein
MTGAIELINKKTETVELEVHRSLMGIADSVDSGGSFEQKSLSDEWFAPDRPGWWSWWNWPSWWQHWNGTARASWKLTLKPGEKATLNANWHYFWR